MRTAEISSGLLPSRAQHDFSKGHFFGTDEILLVRIVVFLHFVRADIHAAAHFALDHLLGHDAVAQLVLVVFPDNALRFDGLLEIIECGEVVLLANFVEALDQVRLDVDIHVLGACDQELLVDHVPQQILLAILQFGLNLLRRAILAILVDFLRESGGSLVVIGHGDDLIVNPGNDLFDDVAFGLGEADGRSQDQGRENSDVWKPTDIFDFHSYHCGDFIATIVVAATLSSQLPSGLCPCSFSSPARACRRDRDAYPGACR